MNASEMKHILRLIRKLDDAAKDKLPRPELDSLFDALVEAFSALSEDMRKQVRLAYIKCPHWGTNDFWWENQSYNLRFKENGGVEDLRRALAHYSMNDGYPDARDAIMGMADLRVAAEQHGIDSRRVFNEIAAVSNADGTWALQSYMQAPTDEVSEEKPPSR